MLFLVSSSDAHSSMLSYLETGSREAKKLNESFASYVRFLSKLCVSI